VASGSLNGGVGAQSYKMVKPTIKEFTATGSIAGLSAKNVVGKFPVDEHPVENNSAIKAGGSNGLDTHAPNQTVGSSQLQVGGDQTQPKANARFSTYEAEKKDTQSQETKDVY
jgi:hypothetical protein